ncbi:hypothetical protein AB0F20_04115 [Streptomyces goshikiensis]
MISCFPDGQGIFLIRPDGYMAWAGTTTTGLITHATTLGLA